MTNTQFYKTTDKIKSLSVRRSFFGKCILTGEFVREIHTFTNSGGKCESAWSPCGSTVKDIDFDNPEQLKQVLEMLK